MRYAADLHLHSRHSAAVSKHMTVETIGRHARIKGIDVIGTGDCLQPEWLTSLESNLLPAEEGWFALRPDLESRIASSLPAILRQPLRFVLSTEVSCAPPGSERLRGIHHLLYFPSFESAHRFRRKVDRHGDLSEGRPALALTSRELLEIAADHDCEMAPAHVMNPYFSSLGTIENHSTLEELFGDLTSHLLAAETGLTSTPEMCRRLSTLDGLGLFSCSDAHSPENIGRECTILKTEPGFAPMIAALRRGSRPQVLGTLKFPLPRTRYYLNRCPACAQSFEGSRCPKCQGRLVMGSRDRLEHIANRATPDFPPGSPPFRMLLPLRYLLGELCGTNRSSKTVDRIYDLLTTEVGHERFILTKAEPDALTRACPPQIAQAIVNQRRAGHVFAPPAKGKVETADLQQSLF
jgi:DNA helicase-2/ATP-dependent DNA helicase PcrA